MYSKFCVLLFIGYFSDLHKKFQEACIFGTNREYQIWSVCNHLILSYDYKNYTPKESDMHTCKSTTKIFSLDSEEFKIYKIHQNLHLDKFT